MSILVLAVNLVVAVLVAVPAAMWGERIYTRYPDAPLEPNFPDLHAKRYPRTSSEWRYALTGKRRDTPTETMRTE